VLTVSDAGARGERADTSGDAIAEWAARCGFRLVARDLVPDETVAIAARLMDWADSGAADVILTTGGTGLTGRDVTPEATQAVLEREAPGIAEALRAAAVPGFPRAMLSRGGPRRCRAPRAPARPAWPRGSRRGR
jgi:molybdopterin adenylyltransferase